MNKKQKKLFYIALISGVVLILLLVFLLGGGIQWVKRLVTNDKPVDSYTWDEYRAMSNEDKDAFFERFESTQAFEDWKTSVQPAETEPDFHWDDPNKAPNQYTWAEYQALSPEAQEAFYQWFESVTAFESWMESAKEVENQTPVWDKPGKSPKEYTWEEYQALSAEEQDAFFHWFGSEADFEAWMNEQKSDENEPEQPSWEATDKKPEDYTWEEYQSLSPQEQDAFYLSFGSKEAFETWMNRVNPVEILPDHWDKPGKSPNEYTWEEYQALTPEEQDLFYQWFETRDDFEAWMEGAKSE